MCARSVSYTHLVKKPKKNSLKQQLKEEAVKLYEAKEAEFPEPEAIRELERVVLLKVIDRKWMDHIDDMEQLRQGVGLQAYGQRDPLVEMCIRDRASYGPGLEFSGTLESAGLSLF